MKYNSWQTLILVICYSIAAFAQNPDLTRLLQLESTSIQNGKNPLIGLVWIGTGDEGKTFQVKVVA